MIESPELTELNQTEKEDAKKKMPTILDIVLRPDLFLNASFLTKNDLPKGTDIIHHLLNNEIKDEDYYQEDYFLDSENKEYVVATLDELYDEVNELYDEYNDNAEPMKPQQNSEEIPVTSSTIMDASVVENMRKIDRNESSFIFPSPEEPQDRTVPELKEIEEFEHSGDGADQREESSGTPIDSTRIEFPRALDTMDESAQPTVEKSSEDKEYLDIDPIPVPNALKGNEETIELSPHNRLFPKPSDPVTESSQEITPIDRNEASVEIITTFPPLRVDNDGETCYCPCQCTQEHTDAIQEKNLPAIKISRTSSDTAT